MKFLVDVNLPKYFSYFNGDQFIHIVDINDELTDTQVWEYALEHNLVILTKDTDFYYRCLSSIIKPKVIYFKLGNMTVKQLHDYFSKNWLQILNLINKNHLIIATSSDIEVVL